MPKILIVDDSLVDQKLIGSLLLRHTTWQLEYAADGEQALKQLLDGHFDLVISDLQMPRLNGLQLVRKIRDELPQLPVLLVTSQGSDEIAVQALREGATSYSPKTKLSKDLVPTARYVLDISDRISRNQESPDHARRRNRLHIVLENDVGQAPSVVATLEANLPHWTESDRLRIGMAINEAIVNAIYHGNLGLGSDLRNENEQEFFALAEHRRDQLPYSQRRVSIEADFDHHRISVVVTDQGQGFDPGSVRDPCQVENLERLCGRGLLLIRSFMDDVSHNDSGNQIRMVKRRSANTE